MAIGESSVGLLFKIKADSSDATKELDKVTDGVKEAGDVAGEEGAGGFAGLAEGIGLSEESAAKLGEALPVVGAALAGIAAAAIGVGAALFSLAKQTSEAGVEIDRFSKLTGFSVETIGALKSAAESAGTSIDEIEEVFESFVELMIEGGQGAEDAVAKIKTLGLDPQTAFKDLEGSFLKVLDKIREMPTQSEKAKVAMDGMGESGLNMVKVASEMTGGTEAFIQKLKQQGLIMDAEGVRKAKAFDSQLSELTSTVKAVTYEFSEGFMPAITTAMKEVTGATGRSQSAWREWGKTVGNEIVLITRGAKLAMALLTDLYLGDLSGRASKAVLSAPAEAEASAEISKPFEDNTINRKKQAEEDAKKAAEEREKEREKREQEEIAARARLNAATKESIQQAFDELREITKQNYELDLITAEKYREDMLENERQFRVRMVELTEQDFAAQLAQAKNQTERKAIETELRTAIEKIGADSDKRITEAEKLVTERKKKLSDEQIKNAEARAQKEIALEKSSISVRQAELERDFNNRLITEEQYIKASGELKLKALEAEKAKLQALTQTAEITHRLKIIEDELSVQTIENAQTMLDFIERQNKALEEQHRLYQDAKTARDAEDTGTDASGTNAGGGGFLGSIFGAITGGMDEALIKLTDFQNVVQSVGSVVGNVFMQMGQAVGSMVQQWVLLGKASDFSMKKMVASVLAGVSAQAITLAVFHTAMGLAALTPWGAAIYGNPFLHFKAAALWATIGVGTALLGRAVAGNSFQNEASRATGATAGNRSAAGGAYSGQEGVTYESGRNAPLGSMKFKHEFEITDKTSGLGQVFQFAIKHDPKLRDAIKEAAQS